MEVLERVFFFTLVLYWMHGSLPLSRDWGALAIGHLALNKVSLQYSLFHFRSGVQLLHRHPYCTVTYQKRGERTRKKKHAPPKKKQAEGLRLRTPVPDLSHWQTPDTLHSLAPNHAVIRVRIQIRFFRKPVHYTVYHCIVRKKLIFFFFPSVRKPCCCGVFFL